MFRTVHAGAHSTTPLTLEPIAFTSAGIPWTDMVRTAAGSRQQGMTGLLEAIVVVGLGAVLVGILTILMVGWSRASARRDEVMVHRALGASRRTLIASALLEAMAMVAPALLAGLGLGWAATRLALEGWPAGLTAWAVRPALPAVVAGFVLAGVSLLVLRHARGHRLVGLPAGVIGLVPLVIQVAGTLAILGAATAVSRQALLLEGQGSATPDATRFRVTTDAASPGVRATRYAALLAGLDASPSVQAAAVTSPGVSLGLGQVDWIQTDCGQCGAATIILQWHDVEAAHHVISPDTFTVLTLPMLAGRAFTAADSAGAPRVVIVNRHLALRHFQDGEAVGRTLRIGGFLSRASYLVVGVVDDRQPSVLGTGTQPRDALYLSVLQHPPLVAELLVQGEGARPPTTPGLVVTPDRGLRDLRAYEASLLAWFGRMVRLEGLLALVAALLGTFVAMRAWSQGLQGELALRRALGAPGWRILLSIVAVTVATVGIAALAARLFVAPSLDWLLRSLLREPATPGSAWSALLLLLAAALGGTLGPAIRAVRSPPARGLA